MPIHRRGRMVAYKAEATPGTAETLTATEGVTIFNTTKVHPNITSTDQPTQGGLEYHASIIEARGADVELGMYWRGSGTAQTPPDWGAILKACGLTQTVNGTTSVDYTANLGSAECVTVAQYQGGRGAAGRKKTAHGCMFDLTLLLEAGKAPMLTLTGKGCWSGVTTGTNISPTYVTTKPPIFTGGTLTWGGSTIVCSRVEFKLNNSVELREDATTATGYKTAWIANVRPTVTVDPEAAVAVDFYADHLAKTTAALVCNWGSAGGNSGSLTAAALQIVDPVGDDERKGMEIDTLTALCTGTTLFTLSHK